MPKLVEMYEKSRQGLAHNQGGIFSKLWGRPRRKTADDVRKAKPEPKKHRVEMKQEKKKKEDEWTENIKRGLADRRKALEELMGD